MSTMTFQEYLENNPTLYPEKIPSALQTTINNWFQYRYVVDDDRFGVYFTRVLNRDYGRYNQLLRIEPGVAQYDWLVEEYLELERTHEGESSETTSDSGMTSHTGTVQNSGTSQRGITVSNSGTETDAGTTSNNQTLATKDATTGYDKTDYGHTIGKDTTVVKTGSETRTHTQDAATNYDENTGTDETTYGKTQSGTESTSDSRSSKTENLKQQGYTDNTATLSKTNPMSSTYESSEGAQIDANGIFTGSGEPTLDWKAPSAQGQTASQHMPVGTTPDTSTTTDTDTATRTSSSADGGTDTTERSQKQSIARDETDTDTFNSVTDTTHDSETNSGSDMVEHDTAIDHTGTVSDAGTTSNTHTINTGSETTETGSTGATTTNDLTDSSTSSGSTEGKHSETEHEVHTGRHGNPAEILAQASDFIKSSSAWSWLQHRLEPCFMGVYEV